jgi:hypothetical protein
MGKATFRPSAATGGGFLDDSDVEIVDAKLVDGPIYRGDERKFLHLSLTLDSDDLKEPSDQTYTLGGKARENFGIDDGQLITLNDHATLNQQANFIKLMDSLVDNGFPEDLLDQADPSAFIGLKGHVNQIPQPKIRDEDKPKTLLLFTSVDLDSISGAAPAKGKKKKTRGKASAKPAAAAEEEEFSPKQVTSKAMELVLEAINANGDKPLARKKLATTIFKMCSEDVDAQPMRTDIVQMISNTEFLEDGPWEFDQEKEEISPA